MAIAYVGENYTNKTNATAPLTFNPTVNGTAGNVLVLIVGDQMSNTLQGVTDNTGSNTWSVIGTHAVSNGVSIGIAWCYQNAAVLTTNTITITTSVSGANLRVIQLEEFSGVLSASAVDTAANTSADSGIGTNGTVMDMTAAATTAQSAEVLICAYGVNSQIVTFVKDSTTSLFTTNSLVNTTAGRTLMTQYKVLSSQSQPTITASYTGGSSSFNAMMVFLKASGPASSSKTISVSQATSVGSPVGKFISKGISISQIGSVRFPRVIQRQPFNITDPLNVFRLNQAGKSPSSSVSTIASNSLDWVTEVMKDRPVSFYRMNATSGNTETDLGSQKNNATYSGSPTFTVPGMLNNYDNSAVTFTASPLVAQQQYMVIPDNDQYSFITNRGLTIEVIAKVGQAGPVPYNPTIFSKLGILDNSSEYALTVSNVNQTPQFNVWNASGTLTRGVVGLPVTSGTYYHFVATLRDNAGILNIDFYQNGVHIDNEPWVSDFLVNGRNSLYLGAEQGDSSGNTNVFRNICNGAIDEFAIYNYALDSSRILAHYNAINVNETGIFKKQTGKVLSPIASSLYDTGLYGVNSYNSSPNPLVSLTNFVSKRINPVVQTVVSVIQGGIRNYLQTIAVIVVTNAALSKSIGKRVSAVVATTTSIVKNSTKAISASVNSTSSINKSDSKIIPPSSVVTSATTTKQDRKNLLASGTTPMTISRSISKLVLATCLSVVLAGKFAGRAVSAIVGSTLVPLKQITHSFSASVTSTVVRTLQAGKLLIPVVTTTVSYGNFISKRVIATCVTVASVARGFVFSRNISAVVNSPSTIIKQVGKNPAAVVTTIMIRGVTNIQKFVNVISTTVPVAQKAVTRAVLGVVTTTVTIFLGIGFRVRVFSLTQPTAVSLGRAMSKGLTIPQNTVLTAGKFISKAISTIVAGVNDPYGGDLFGAGPFGLGMEFIIMTKQVMKAFTTSSATTVTLSFLKTFSKIFSVAVTTTQDLFGLGGFGSGNFGTGTIVLKQVNKFVSPIVSTPVSFAKQILKAIYLYSYSGQVLSDSPQVYYRMDETSGNVLDSSGNGRNLTTVFGGSLQYQTAGLLTRDADTAITFDGLTSVASTTYSPQSYPMTVEAWIKPAVVAGTTQRIVAVGNPNGWGFGINGSAGVRFTTFSVKDYDFPAAAFSRNQVFHVVAIFRADNSCTAYVNNVSQGTVTGASPPLVSTKFLTLGNQSLGGASEKFNGVIDEVALYNYELSSIRIAAHYNAGINPSAVGAALSLIKVILKNSLITTNTVTSYVKQATKSLLATVVSTGGYRRDYQAEVLFDKPASYWRMDSTGSTETDLGFLGNTGTYNNNPILGVAGALAYDPAVQFQSRFTQTMSASDNDAYSYETTGGLTIEMFAKWGDVPPNGGGNRNIVSKGQAGNYEWAWQVTQGTSQPIFIAWNSVGSNLRSLATNVIPASGVYHHYVATIQDNAGTATASVYEDGVFRSSGTFPTASGTNGIAGIRVGGRADNAGYFDGMVDEVAIYNYALSPARISAHYNAINANVTAPYNLIGKFISATSTSVDSVNKLGTRNIITQVVSTASRVKQVGKNITAVSTTITTLARGLSKFLTLQATVASVATVTKRVGKSFQTSFTSTVSLSKTVGKVLSPAVTTTIPKIKRFINKTVVDIVVVAVNATPNSFRSKVIAVTVATTAIPLKTILKKFTVAPITTVVNLSVPGIINTASRVFRMIGFKRHHRHFKMVDSQQSPSNLKGRTRNKHIEGDGQNSFIDKSNS